jgi:GNAT superfamily N-acetyltransferase
MIVRKFEPKDQRVVHTMYRSAMHQYDHLGLQGMKYASFAADPDDDMSDIQCVFMDSKDELSCFWVAEIEDKIVGFVGAVPSTEFNNKDYVELVRLFVDPDYREHDVGRKLVNAAEKWAKEVGYKYINLTALSRLDARPNYPKPGFTLKEFDVYERLDNHSSAIDNLNYWVNSMDEADSSDNVKVRVFEPRDQNEVKNMFLFGESQYMHLGIVGKRYAWSVRDKTSPVGELSDIQTNFMSVPDEKRKGCFWVAEMNNKMVGFLGAKKNPKLGEGCVELVRMAVLPSCRQKGVGRKLITALEDWAKSEGCKFVKLFTLEDLFEPNLLYPKCGFTVNHTEELDVTEQLSCNEPTFINTVHYSKCIAG